MRIPTQTRILLVDDHETMRDGLRVVLDRESELEVLAMRRTAPLPCGSPGSSGRTS